jgi:hypothetical protein
MTQKLMSTHTSHCAATAAGLLDAELTNARCITMLGAAKHQAPQLLLLLLLPQAQCLCRPACCSASNRPLVTTVTTLAVLLC